ncbi:AAA family ATPase [Frisingicoccus sp.]|uniref:AAA family ATPase n=1 Tax=Frisingicoccus sp. TaxID=1918627 RepID=UPI003AB43BD4
MKPLKLILSAFGSYGGTECVDFEKMRQGLFLITGDTGAGKTTIFDGISYALYGQTSGRRRDGDMMRSQYASDTDETYVEFTFCEMGKTYTIRRNPTWERRSRRKNKAGEYALTKESAKVELTMPDGKIFPGKMKETDQKIVEIIGMDMNQFSQVSMISQGDFMKLLLASSKERKEIFSRIFPTKIYWQIQNSLAEQEKEMYLELEDVRKTCRHELENVQCLPESDYREAWKEKGTFSDVDNSEWMNLLKAMIEELETFEKNLKKSLEKVDQTLAAGKDFEAKELRKEQFLAEMKRLNDELPQIRQQMEESGKILEERRSLYESEWPKKQEQWLILSREMPEYDRLAEEDKKLKQLRERLRECGAAAANTEKKEKEIRQLRETLLREQENLQDSGVRLNQAEQKLKDCGEAMEVLKQLWNKKTLWEKYISEEAAAKKKAEESILHYQKMSQRHDLIYEKFIAAQAGLMAQKLVEGEPCPVCGSLHHPALHPESGEIIDRQMVDRAKAEREAAEKAVEKARKNCQKLSEQGAELKSGILHEAGDLMADSEQLFETGGFWKKVFELGRHSQQAWQQAKQQWQQIKSENIRFEKNAEKLKEFEEKQELLRDKHMHLAQQQASLAAEEKSRTEGMILLQSKMSFFSKKEAEQRMNNLKKEMDQLKNVLKMAEEAVETRTANFQRKQGRLGERRQTMLQAETEAAQAGKIYRAMLEAGGWPEETDRDMLEKNREKLLEQEKNIYAVRQTNQKACNRLEKLLKDYGEEQENFARLRHLSRIANGQMPGMPRIDFQTYMQRRYFRQMVDAANRRLIGMSSHQFLLECRSLDNLGRQGEAGLDLDVYSLVNDNIRDVKTLSGGESFMAALALALGMADVIQQEAGKIHVDTLFIDEGFGSLDENARNQAIRILSELAGTDRLVGIISHVSELKEQIEQKIVVKKTDRGSRLLV